MLNAELSLWSLLPCFHSPGFLSRDSVSPEQGLPAPRLSAPGPGTGRCPLLLCGLSCHTRNHGETTVRSWHTITTEAGCLRVTALSAAFLTNSFSLPSSLSQVYVSYDYGKSFQKISEKLNFGAGDSSEAVIAQFYHSPADNRRVRRAPRLGRGTSWAVLGEEGCTRGLGEGPLGHLCSMTGGR